MSVLTRELCQSLKDSGFDQTPVEQDFIYKGDDVETTFVSDPKKIRKGSKYLRCPSLEAMMKTLKELAGVVTVDMEGKEDVWVARPKIKVGEDEIIGMGADRDEAAAMLWLAIKNS